MKKIKIIDPGAEAKFRIEVLKHFEESIVNADISSDTLEVLSFQVPVKRDTGTWKVDLESKEERTLIYLVLDKAIIFNPDNKVGERVGAWTNDFGIWKVSFESDKGSPDANIKVLLDEDIDQSRIRAAFEEINTHCEGFHFEFHETDLNWMFMLVKE